MLKKKDLVARSGGMLKMRPVVLIISESRVLEVYSDERLCKDIMRQ
jgi:hypothetical protein